MSKFPRNLVIALAVCSATAFLYLPSLLAQDASKKVSPTSMKSGPASETSAKTKKSADVTPSAPATKDAVAKDSVVKDPGAKDSSAEKSKVASSKLRLPRYFSGIVDEDQREQCLAIQLEYRQKVAELEEELSRVRQDEMTALEKVLTDSQRKLLEKKRSDVKSKASAELTKTASESDEGGM